MNVLASLKKFADKDYRDGFLRAQIGGSIAYQVQALRAKLGKTQTEFGELTGKTQNQISRLENSGSGMVNVQTLLDIAAGADVALVVQFVSYPEFLRRTSSVSEAALQPETILESLDAAQRPRQPRWTAYVEPYIDIQSARRGNQGKGGDLGELLGRDRPPTDQQGQSLDQPEPHRSTWN